MSQPIICMMAKNMDYIVGDFIEKASKISNLDELGVLFFTALNKMGFTEWGYQAVDTSNDRPIVLSTFPKEWVDHYLDNKFSQIDPLVARAPKCFIPFQWSELLKSEPLTTKQKSYWAEACSYGLSEGVGIPIHGYNGRLAIVTLVSKSMPQLELAKIFNNYRDQIHILSLIYNSYASDIMNAQKNTPHPVVQLTKREQECMQWVVRGKTSWEISEILHVSEHTVIFHIENAKKKFGVFSRHEAVIKGILCGVLES